MNFEQNLCFCVDLILELFRFFAWFGVVYINFVCVYVGFLLGFVYSDWCWLVSWWRWFFYWLFLLRIGYVCPFWFLAWLLIVLFYCLNNCLKRLCVWLAFGFLLWLVIVLLFTWIVVYWLVGYLDVFADILYLSLWFRCVCLLWFAWIYVWWFNFDLSFGYVFGILNFDLFFDVCWYVLYCLRVCGFR